MGPHEMAGLPGELEQFFDRIAASFRILENPAQILPQPFFHLILFQCQLGIQRDPAQWIVQLMGDAGGQFSE